MTKSFGSLQKNRKRSCTVMALLLIVIEMGLSTRYARNISCYQHYKLIICIIWTVFNVSHEDGEWILERQLRWWHAVWFTRKAINIKTTWFFLFYVWRWLRTCGRHNLIFFKILQILQRVLYCHKRAISIGTWRRTTCWLIAMGQPNWRTSGWLVTPASQCASSHRRFATFQLNISPLLPDLPFLDYENLKGPHALLPGTGNKQCIACRWPTSPDVLVQIVCVNCLLLEGKYGELLFHK